MQKLGNEFSKISLEQMPPKLEENRWIPNIQGCIEDYLGQTVQDVVLKELDRQARESLPVLDFRTNQEKPCTDNQLKEIAKACPNVRKIYIGEEQNFSNELGIHLQRYSDLEELEIQNSLDAAAVLKSTFPKLRRFSCNLGTMYRLSKEAIEFLSKHAQIKQLNLQMQICTTQGFVIESQKIAKDCIVQQIAKMPIRELQLSQVESPDLKTLATMETLEKLHLQFSPRSVRNEDLCFLGKMKKLTSLHMKDFEIPFHKLSNACAFDPIKTLRTVTLENVSNTTAQTIFTLCPNIEELTIIPDDEILREVAKLNTLKILSLRRGIISKEGLHSLSQLPNLEKVSFTYCSGELDYLCFENQGFLSFIGNAPKLKELTFVLHKPLEPEFLEALNKVKPSLSLKVLCTRI